MSGVLVFSSIDEMVAAGTASLDGNPVMPQGRRSHALPSRIAGLDYARFVALIGMMAAHVWAFNVDGSPGLLATIVAGKAAALFAVLAGVGIALTSHRNLVEGQIWAARRNVFGRGLVLVLLGLTLSLISPVAIVILPFYGVIFWCMIPLLRLPSRMLLIAAVSLAVIWPFVSTWLDAAYPPASGQLIEDLTWAGLADPAMFARTLFLSGGYPVPTWVVYAIVGLVIGRLILATANSRDRARLSLLLGGVGVTMALLSWGASTVLGNVVVGSSDEAHRGLFGDLALLTTSQPHTGTTFDLALTTGIALAAIALFLSLGEAIGVRTRRIVEPIRVAGAAPLTIYTAHILATLIGFIIFLASHETTGAPENDTVPWLISSSSLWAIHVVGALLIGTLLVLLKRRGPMETLMSWTGRLFARTPHAKPPRP